MNKILAQVSRIIPDRLYLEIMYYHFFHKFMSFKNPKTYNEKLQWLKLYDRKPFYTQLVDKYEVKKYISNVIGEEYVIPTLGIWNSVDEIDIKSLPDQFVLKTTHDSHGVEICRDKNSFNIKKAKEYLNSRIKRNGFWYGREWPYKNIKPRIIAEKYIGTKEIPNDYKFFMFDGKMDAVMVCTERETGKPQFRFYDKNWNRLTYMPANLEPTTDVERPINFEMMVSLVRSVLRLQLRRIPSGYLFLHGR